MFDFTLSLQPIIQFMTLPPPPCFEELVSTYADKVGDAFDGAATRVRAIVHFRQFQTFGNLSDYSHIQISSFFPTTASSTESVSPLRRRSSRNPGRRIPRNDCALLQFPRGVDARHGRSH